jgi:hypothetical protein
MVGLCTVSQGCSLASHQCRLAGRAMPHALAAPPRRAHAMAREHARPCGPAHSLLAHVRPGQLTGRLGRTHDFLPIGQSLNEIPFLFFYSI